MQQFTSRFIKYSAAPSFPLASLPLMCIDATVRAAVDLGFETTLIEDACATLELSYNDKVVPAEQVHYAFVGALNGMYCAVESTEDFLQKN